MISQRQTANGQERTRSWFLVLQLLFFLLNYPQIISITVLFKSTSIISTQVVWWETRPGLDRRGFIYITSAKFLFLFTDKFGK